MGFRDFERFKVSLYFFRLHGDPPGENWKQKHRSLLTNFHWCFVYRRDLNSKIPQSLDTDVQRPFYSVAIVALLPYMGRERRWPRWIKKASHIGSKRLCKIRIYLRELAAVIILVAPSKMLIQHYNDEISVRLRWQVMYKRIRKWICWVSQVRLHLAGSTVKIRHWQIWPYHWLDSTIKKRHVLHLGAFFTQSWNASPSQFPSISFKMHWHDRFCEIFQSKCQNMHCGDGPTAQIGNKPHGNSSYRKYRAFDKICIMH